MAAGDARYRGSILFPFYVYDKDGSNRRENVTDWALAQFRECYSASLPRKRGESSRSKTPPAHAGGSPQRRDITK